MTYIESINTSICQRINEADKLVCFGQNITTASCLSGLTRNLPVGGGIEAINTPNCENAMVAFGFGMMLEGVDSIFFVKQLDFLLLTCDQMVNTYNMARQSGATGSFTIVPVVVDSGFEGPQSRLNNLADYCSMANMPGYALADPTASQAIIQRHLIAPGFRIMAPSQRLFRSEAETGPATPLDDEASIFELATGTAATIVVYNYAWPQARKLRADLAADGHNAALFGVAESNSTHYAPILNSLKQTGRLIVIDDSRSHNRPADRMRAAASDAQISYQALPLYRNITPDDIRPNSDQFNIDSKAVSAWLANTHSGTNGHSNG